MNSPSSAGRHSKPSSSEPASQRKSKFADILGPGLITGASDDDPSGIATYAQAGAMFAFGMLWTLLFTWPLMVAAQELSARVGRVTGEGLAANIRRVYSIWIALPLVLLLIAANVLNLGADIAAMGEAARLMFKYGSPHLYAIAFGLISLILEVLVRYKNYSRYLKWLSLALIVYVATAFLGHVAWRRAIHGLFIPHLQADARSLSMFIAIIGTTISPYLFFWQAALENEEIRSTKSEHRLKKYPEQAKEQFSRIRLDTCVGMGISNIIGLFIMLTMAVTLGSQQGGPHKIDSAADAADALGHALGLGGSGILATWLFSLGIIGTGLLAVPVLAGSAAYAVSELFSWREGLNRKFGRARAFYGVVITATVLGVALNFIKSISPIQALVWVAVINGIVAVPALAMIVHMSSDPRVMGKFAKAGRMLRGVGWLTTLIMLLAVVGLFATWGK